VELAGIKTTVGGALTAVRPARTPYFLSQAKAVMNSSSIKPEQLRTIKSLNGFEDEERLRLLEFLEPVRCDQNTVLLEEGEPGDCMYFILEGQMRVFHRKKNQNVTVKSLEAGDAFGDIALFNGTPRLASVDAVCDSQLLKLSAAGLAKLAGKHPDLSAKFLRSIAISLSQMYRDFH
jgi:CRP-like cAMP-binding protein